MRLTICSEYFHPDTGSTGRVLVELSEALTRRWPDLEIGVVTSDRDYRSGASSQAEVALRDDFGIRTVRTLKLDRRSAVKRLLGDIWFSVGALFRLLAGPRPDLILVVTNPFVLPAAVRLYSLIRGVPYLYLIHDLYPDIGVAVGVVSENSLITRALRRLQRWMLGGASKVIALGRCNRALLMGRYDVPASEVEVITNWANPDEVKPVTDPAIGEAFRREHGLGEFVCLYSGNLGLFHDFDTLLDAAKRIDDPRIQVLIVGEGGAKEYIRERIESEKIDNVRLMPLVPYEDLPRLLAAADVAVVTLKEGAEGQAIPLKLYNLLAAGKPILVVTAPWSEPALVVTESGSGVQIAQGDSERLARLLIELADDPERVACMGRRARQALEQNYTLDQVVERYHEVLTDALQGAVR